MWYFAEGEQRQGPVSEPELLEMIQTGKLSADSLVWQQGMENWQPVREIPAFQAVLPTPLRALPKSLEMADYTDVTHGNENYGASAAAAATPVLENPMFSFSPQPAGFWIRLLASLLDGLVILVLYLPFGLILTFATSMLFVMFQEHPLHPLIASVIKVISTLFGWILSAVYSGFFLSRFGATPGKMVCGLQVITQDGGQVSFLRGVGRFLGECLSSFLCNIGYLMVLFNEQKLALHDHICKTRVIVKNRF